MDKRSRAQDGDVCPVAVDKALPGAQRAGMVWTLLQIALGGALGSVMRFLSVTAAARVLGAGFPYGTLGVNVLGSFVIGGLAVWLVGARAGVSPVLITGFLGGFTTFSAFSLDALRLWEAGAAGAAAGYVLASVGFSLGAVWLGAVLVRGVLS